MYACTLIFISTEYGNSVFIFEIFTLFFSFKKFINIMIQIKVYGIEFSDEIAVYFVP